MNMKNNFNSIVGHNSKIARAALAALILFGFAVVSLIFALNSQSALMMETEYDCGREEHTHGPGCYNQALVCKGETAAGLGTPTDLNAGFGTPTDLKIEVGTPTDLAGKFTCLHTDTDKCYETILVCGFDYEHEHTDDCKKRQVTTFADIKLPNGGGKLPGLPNMDFQPPNMDISLALDGIGNPVEVTNLDINVTTVSNGTSFKIRVDYKGGANGIQAGDYISIKIDNSANDFIKIAGFGNNTFDIHGDEPIGNVGTVTYRNDPDGNYYLDLEFDNGYNNYYAGLGDLGNITGWYEAWVRVEYKQEIKTETTKEIDILINGMLTIITVDVKPGGGPGSGTPTPVTPGSNLAKGVRYGNLFDTWGNWFPDNHYEDFDTMRWSISLGFQNLTWRDLRASNALGLSGVYYTTRESLAYSNNNPAGNRYQSQNEPYIAAYGNSINNPYLYKNVVLDDYLLVGNYLNDYCSAHDYVLDSIRIIRILGREQTNSWWGPSAFRPLADTNFLKPTTTEPINRFMPDLDFSGYRGLTVAEFLAQMQSEGQLLGMTVADILTVDYVDNSENPIYTAYGGKDIIGDYILAHFNLKLGDFHFSSAYNKTVDLMGYGPYENTGVRLTNILATNLPYGYIVYYDTKATEAVLTKPSADTFKYLNAATFKSNGESTEVSNVQLYMWMQMSGGSGSITSLNIRKTDEDGERIQGVKFTLTQTNITPNKSREIFTTINGAASFILGLGTYILEEEVPEGSRLIPIAPIEFTVTDVSKPVDLTKLLPAGYANAGDITFVTDTNVIKNYKTENEKVVIKGQKTVTGTNIPNGEIEFIFTLKQVEKNGNVMTNPAVQPQTKTVTWKNGVLDPEGGKFEFTIEGLSKGMYYFQISETEGNAPNWFYDKNDYIVVVVVYDDGRLPDIFYPQAGAEGKTATNIPSSYVSNSQIKYDKGYYFFTDGSEGFCADKWYGVPAYSSNPGTELYNPFYNSHSPAALANAIYMQLSKPSSCEDFFTMFGFGNDPFYPSVSNPDTQRNRLKDLTAFAIWYFELRTLYPEYDWDIDDWSKWPATLPQKTFTYPNGQTWELMPRGGNIPVDFLRELVSTSSTTYVSDNGQDLLKKMVKTIDRMMASYSREPNPEGKCISSLEMTYQPVSDNSGWLSFKYDGYIPPEHQLTLSWEIKAGMTVTIKDDINGNLISNASGTRKVYINERFYIEHSGTGSIEFTLDDGMYYLVNGSIDGRYYISQYDSNHSSKNQWRQKILFGYAKFAKMKCTLEIGKGEQVTFKNKYQAPGELTLKKLVTGNGAETDKYFNFTVTFTGPKLDQITSDKFSKSNGGATWTGTLKHGDEVKFFNIPAGTTYRIEEAPNENYKAGISNSSGIIISNTTINAICTNERNTSGPILPETGGIVLPLAAVGTAIMLIAAGALVYRRKKESIREHQIADYTFKK
jgi:LPXTG-motif cell wall-anchored protein